MGKEAFNLMLTSLLILALVGTHFTISVNANPMPEINPIIRIINHQNATYETNNIMFNFTAISSYIAFPICYTLDNSDKVAVDNITVISKEDANIGKNPEVDRITVEGNFVLSNLTQGWHNVTLYMVSDRDMWIYKDYVKGDVLALESVSFFVDKPIINVFIPTDFPIIKVSASIVTIVIALCLLLYIRNKAKISYLYL